jgi:hypothetical protein
MSLTPQTALLFIAQFAIALLLLQGIRYLAKRFNAHEWIFLGIKVMRFVVFVVGIFGVIDVSIGLSALLVGKW